MTIVEFRDKLFEAAKKEGFSEYEIYYVSGESFKTTVFEKEVDNYSVNSTRGLSFRGLYNGKMGYAYTEILDEEAILMLIHNARANAQVIENEDKEIIYAGDTNYARVESFNDELTNVSAEQKIKLALDMERLTLEQDPRVKSVKYSGVQSFDESVSIMNSKGLNLTHRLNGAYAVLIPVIKDGDQVNTAVSFRATNRFQELNPGELVKEAVDNAVAYIGAKPVPSGKYRVVLRNDAAADLLEAFSDIFSADRVQKGLSLLKGKVGTAIGSKAVTIIDDPLMKDGLCSMPFDAEGVATCTKEVVREGELVTLLYNLKTAMKDGVKTTGNASKASYASPVGISPTNFCIKPGSKPLDEILRELGDGLYITELQGMHSGANSVSGDFSLAAKGFIITKGVIGRAVEQITIAGNFFKLLMDIEDAGSDLRFGMPSGDGCFGSPALLVRELSVAGK